MGHPGHPPKQGPRRAAHRRRPRPVAGRHHPVQAAQDRRLRHRPRRRHFAHRHRRAQPGDPGGGRPAPRARPDPRGRHADRRRHARRADRRPGCARAGGIPPAQERAGAGARQAQAPEEVARGHPRRRGHRAAANIELPGDIAPGQGGRRPASACSAPSSSSSTATACPARRSSSRPIAAWPRPWAASPVVDPHPRHRRRQEPARRRAAPGGQSGARPARHPLLPGRAAAVPGAVARHPARLAYGRVACWSRCWRMPTRSSRPWP
jgi:hypothetical protein